MFKQSPQVPDQLINTGRIKEPGVIRDTHVQLIERIDEWQAGVQEFHGGGVSAITSNEETGVTMVETWFDVTFKQGGRMKMEEVAVQYWEGDRIKRERFYFNMPG